MSDFNAWIEKNKALWTRVYDEVIKPDLDEEWKKSVYTGKARRIALTTRQGLKSMRKS
jgi:uncharacterized protein YdeI (YjbR/CyaY-like superfamily)